MYFEIADGRHDYFDRIPNWPKDTVNLTLEAPRTTTLATAHSWMEETRLDEQAIDAVGNRRLRSASLNSDHRTHPRSLARYMARRGTRRGKTDRKAAPVTVLFAFAVLVGIFVAWGLARAGRTAGTFDRAFPFGHTLPTLTADETGLANQFWNELLENEKAPRASPVPESQDRRAQWARSRDRSDTAPPAGGEGSCPAGDLRSRLARGNG